ncbi:MAG: hypothetical protein LBB54_03055 [Cellulomonadaceae bacterium]|jgi:hypothetical protein|nr:hypothetical protein [Cellulomonadaceae bacterium]
MTYNRTHANRARTFIAAATVAVLGIALAVGPENRAEAYWANNPQIQTNNVDDGRLLDNLMCYDSGRPSGGPQSGQATASSNPAVVAGANDIEIGWSYPPKQGVVVYGLMTVTSDGGTALAQADWQTQDMMAASQEPYPSDTPPGSSGAGTPGALNAKGGSCAWGGGTDGGPSGPCYNATSAAGGGAYGGNTGDVIGWFKGPSRYSAGKFPIRATQQLAAPGLNRVRFGVNIPNSSRSIGGQVAIWATGPGGWTAGTFPNGIPANPPVSGQNDSQLIGGNSGTAPVGQYALFNWTINYKGDGTAAVSCTPANTTVDIAIGPDSTSAGRFLYGQGGMTTDSQWIFANMVPGESMAREVVVTNVGGASVTLDGKISTPQPFGLNVNAYSYAGDVSTPDTGTGTVGVATNAPASTGAYAPNPTTGQGTGVAFRQGSCSASGQTAQQSMPVPTASASFMKTPNSITLAPGASATFCFVLSMATTSPDGNGLYEGQDVPPASTALNTIQNSTDTDAVGSPSLSVQFIATGTGSAAGATDTATMSTTNTAFSADYVPPINLPNPSQSAGQQCVGGDSAHQIPWGQPFQVSWGDVITSYSNGNANIHGTTVDHYEVKLTVGTVNLFDPDDPMASTGLGATADPTNAIASSDWLDNSWLSAFNAAYPTSWYTPPDANGATHPPAANGLSLAGMTMMPPSDTENVTSYNQTSGLDTPLGATSPTPPTWTANGDGTATVTYEFPNSVTGIGWGLHSGWEPNVAAANYNTVPSDGSGKPGATNIGSADPLTGETLITALTDATDPTVNYVIQDPSNPDTIIDVLRNGDVVSGTVDILAVGPGGWTSNLKEVLWTMYGNPKINSCLVQDPIFDMTAGNTTYRAQLQGQVTSLSSPPPTCPDSPSPSCWTDLGWSVQQGLLPGESISTQYVVQNAGTSPFGLTGTLALTSGSKTSSLQAQVYTYNGDQTGMPANTQGSQTVTPTGGTSYTLRQNGCLATGATITPAFTVSSTPTSIFGSSPPSYLADIEPGDNNSITLCIVLTLPANAPQSNAGLTGQGVQLVLQANG